VTDLILHTHATAGTPADDAVSLPFDLRQRARLRVVLVSGRDAGLKLPRGTILRGGAVLLGTGGLQVRVNAAPETVSTVRCADPWALARAAYHLGNRHVWVQVGEGWLRYLHDHVLDAMVRGLGLEVTVEEAPFEPEGGAYSSGHEQGHGHGHAHGHRHEHEHQHEHEHEHGHGHGHGHAHDNDRAHGLAAGHGSRHHHTAHAPGVCE